MTGFTRRTAANVEGIGNDNAAYLETTLEPQAELYVVRFKAPTTPGNYMWQCRVPCGLGYLDGVSGPMQTIGDMTGNMEVTA